ncbi:MAG: putative glycoside hydrolase [Elusimicrobiota bacterium]
MLKKRHKKGRLPVAIVIPLIAVLIFLLNTGSYRTDDPPVPVTKPVAGKPEYVRGVHLTAWVAGSSKMRSRLEPLLSRDKLNTIVIVVKEVGGEIYLPGVRVAQDYGIKTIYPIPKLEKYLVDLKSRGVYPVARLTVFKDCSLVNAKPQLAVKNPDGSIWKDYKGKSWSDPYNKEVWKYNVEIAKHAIQLGFEEIQYDYIRFPSDGDTWQCRYSAVHNSTAASQVLVGFLEYSKKELSVPVSIDVFGLTPSVNHDMGIGQNFMAMAEVVDYISPMMYPSHYRKGEYNIPDPNKEPYRTVYRCVSDANLLLKDKFYKLRPYLQDFSLGHKYGPEEVKAQILACYDNGIFDWLLWDPRCLYTLEAINEMVKWTPQNYKPSALHQLLQSDKIRGTTTQTLQPGTTTQTLQPGATSPPDSQPAPDGSGAGTASPTPDSPRDNTR